MNRVTKNAFEPEYPQRGHPHVGPCQAGTSRTLAGQEPRDLLPSTILTFPMPHHRGVDTKGRHAELSISIVDKDTRVLTSLRRLLRLVRLPVETYTTTREFLDNLDPRRPGCLIVEVRMPALSGMDLCRRLQQEGNTIPAILLTEHASVPLAVRALREGAFHFLLKPVRKQHLLALVQEAVALDLRNRRQAAEGEAAAARFARLPSREQEILSGLIAGRTDRALAARLGVTTATVEFHRAAILRKVGAGSVPELIRLVLRADRSHPVLPSGAKSLGL